LRIAEAVTLQAFAIETCSVNYNLLPLVILAEVEIFFFYPVTMIEPIFRNRVSCWEGEFILALETALYSDIWELFFP
jgi:hypothetical protein